MRLVAFFLTLWAAVLGCASAQVPSFRQTLSPPGWILPGATADFDFEHGRYWLNGNIATPDQFLTSVRNAVQTCTPQGGALFYAAANVPCITDRGLQSWSANTNLLKQSALNTTNANWTATASTLNAAATTAPDGNTTAATIIEGGTNAQHLIVQSVTKAASAILYTFSVYGKSSTRTRIYLQMDDAASNGAAMTCDLAGQQVGVAAAGVGTPFTTISGQAIAVGPSWTRCTISATSNTALAVRGLVALDNGSGTAAASNSYQGDSASGVIAWGAQLEANAFRTAGPYVPTTTASVTTALDNHSWTINPVLAPRYSFLVQAVADIPIETTLNQTLIGIDDGTNNNRYNIGRSLTTGVVTLFLEHSTVVDVNVTQIGTNVMTQGLVSKAASSAIAGAENSIFNGGTVLASTAAILPVTPTVLHFGNGNATATAPLQGVVQRTTIFNGTQINVANVGQ